ncbi:hypothetical protein GCM10026986_05190 [Nitrincola alkalisediminis]
MILSYATRLCDTFGPFEPVAEARSYATPGSPGGADLTEPWATGWGGDLTKLGGGSDYA